MVDAAIPDCSVTVQIMVQAVEVKVKDVDGFDLSAFDAAIWAPGPRKIDLQR